MGAEKQKMLSGDLYLAGDNELVEERESARKMLFELEQTFDREERKQILCKLLGHTGNEFLIESHFHCDYGYNIYLGENFYANVGCTILDGAKVVFGNNVLLAPNVGIYTAGHPLDMEQRKLGLEYARPVTIGNNVWIGADVTILPGVSIGDNSVIGAASVVTKNIPANVVAMGNPCRVMKEL